MVKELLRLVDGIEQEGVLTRPPCEIFKCAPLTLFLTFSVMTHERVIKETGKNPNKELIEGKRKGGTKRRISG